MNPKIYKTASVFTCIFASLSLQGKSEIACVLVCESAEDGKQLGNAAVIILEGTFSPHCVSTDLAF